MEGVITEQVLVIVATGIVTGAVSAVGTVGAIRVHIQYLREGLSRAHHRIDDIERRTRKDG